MASASDDTPLDVLQSHPLDEGDAPFVPASAPPSPAGLGPPSPAVVGLSSRSKSCFRAASSAAGVLWQSYAFGNSPSAIERAMLANAERRRPQALQMPERLERLLRQTRQGFEALDRELAGRDWYIADHVMQPDITTAVGVTFVRHIFPGLIDHNVVPRLDAVTARCEALPAFRSMQID